MCTPIRTLFFSFDRDTRRAVTVYNSGFNGISNAISATYECSRSVFFTSTVFVNGSLGNVQISTNPRASRVNVRSAGS